MPKYEHYLIDDVKKSSARQLFTVISTFAGGGGSSTGYRLAGGKVIAINEFVEEAVKTYSTNFPDTIVIPGDIKKISGKDFLDAGNLKVGNFQQHGLFHYVEEEFLTDDIIKKLELL
jgi:DNA (cytosine-5)-methyltransferase 1